MMMQRAHTEPPRSDVPAPHQAARLFPNFTELPTYSADLIDASSSTAASHLHPHRPSRYQASWLSKPLPAPLLSMWEASFDTWHHADRARTFPAWRCPGRTYDVNAIRASNAPNRHLQQLADVFFREHVFLFRGGVTQLVTDAIVNAANESCMGGGGVDGAIHDAAGPLLLRECCTFDGCATGHVRLTKGYNLPARFVLHAVGPMGKRPAELASCYRGCLRLAEVHQLKSIGFCCISTGIFGYPLLDATRVALQVCLKYLWERRMVEPAATLPALVFACFRDEEFDAYERLVVDISREVVKSSSSDANQPSTAIQRS